MWNRLRRAPRGLQLLLGILVLAWLGGMIYLVTLIPHANVQARAQLSMPTPSVQSPEAGKEAAALVDSYPAPQPTETAMPEPTATDAPEPTATDAPVPTATSAPVKPVFTYTQFRAAEAVKICKEDIVTAIVKDGNVVPWEYEIPANSHFVAYMGNGLISSKDGKTSAAIEVKLDANGNNGEHLVDVFNTSDQPQTIVATGYPNFSYHQYCAGQTPDLEKMAGGSVGAQPDNPRTCGLDNGCPWAEIVSLEVSSDGVKQVNVQRITEAYAFDVAQKVPVPVASFWKSAGNAGPVKLKQMQDQNAVDVKLSAGDFARFTVPNGKQHRLDIQPGMAVKILNDSTGELVFDSSDGGVVILDYTGANNTTYIVTAGSEGTIVHYEYRYGFEVADAAPAIVTVMANNAQALRASSATAPVIMKITYDGAGTKVEEVQP